MAARTGGSKPVIARQEKQGSGASWCLYTNKKHVPYKLQVPYKTSSFLCDTTGRTRAEGLGLSSPVRHVPSMTEHN